MSESLTTTAPATALAPAKQHRSGSARLLRALAVTLIVLGALALVDALITLVWQEPLTALYATIEQAHLGGELLAVEGTVPTPVERRALASMPDEQARISYLAGQLERRSHDGAAVGRILIPRVGADYVMVDGTDTGDLIRGPGIYRETHFPGIPGTTAIAGHRTTYLAPFREINLLKPGNHILLNMPYAHFTYTVTGQRVVWPTDVQAAVANVGHTRLVLSACTPVFSAEKRLLVYARLTRTVPVGAARLLPGGAIPRPIESPARPAAAPALPAMLVSLDPHSVSPLV
ncbi:MAG TPA: class E sortase [Solirubrobacteraceae bacterium]|jgi:sortase A|nr:class E sortase [Solirubrobacteraceae bacterium]